MTDYIDSDGRLKLGAPCTLSDGRDAKVVRRSSIREAMTLTEKDGKNHFLTIRIYDALLQTAEGEKVRQERIRIDEPGKPVPKQKGRWAGVGMRGKKGGES